MVRPLTVVVLRSVPWPATSPSLGFHQSAVATVVVHGLSREEEGRRADLGRLFGLGPWPGAGPIGPRPRAPACMPGPRVRALRRAKLGQDGPL
jgi:hypothetical protein